MGEAGLTLGRTSLIAAADSPSVDAFSRWRVSEPIVLFDSKLIYDLHTLWWEDHSTVNGGSSLVANQSAVRLTTGSTASGSRIYRQTRRYFQYQPGKSQLVLITADVGAAVNRVRKRWGYFDAENGLFWQQQDGTMSVVRRSYTSGAVVDTEIDQSDWNLDKMDGTGPSGYSLDPEATQIYVIDFQWLGVGRVRFGLDIGGVLYYVHEMVHANDLETVYMTTPDLPVRYEIENTGTAPSIETADFICVSVMSEGGQDDVSGYPLSVGRTTTAPVTTRRAVLSIRPTATFASKVNRMLVHPHMIEGFASSATAYWELVYNPTFTAGGGALTWTAADSLSGIEYSLHADANAGAITGGTTLESGYLVAAGSTRGSLSHDFAFTTPLTLDAAGANPRALSVVMTRIGTGTADCAVAISWHEHR